MYGVLYGRVFSGWSVYYWTAFCIMVWIPAVLLWRAGHADAATSFIVMGVMLGAMIIHVWYRKLRGLLPPPRRM